MLTTRKNMVKHKAAGVLTIVAIACVVTASAWATGAVSLDSFFPWLQGSNAPTLEPSQATRLFGIDTVSGRQETYWAVPTSDGQTCIASRVTEIASGAAPADAPPAFANDGLNCQIGGPTQPAGQIQTFLSWEPADGSFAGPGDGQWIVTLLGHLPAGSSASQVALESVGGATALPLDNGYFATVLPGTTSSLDALPGAGTLAVAALNDGGKQVGSVDLRSFVSQAGAP